MEKKEEDTIAKKLEQLRSETSRLERESRIGSEDQLFFGLIVSLALFVVTLPLTDFASFIQLIGKLDYVTAMNLAQSIKNISIVCLILSAILRYYASIKPNKGARLFSFLLLLMALDVFLVLFFPILSFNLSIEVRTIAFPLSFFALLVVFLLMGKFVESKVIMFYAERGFLLKRYAKPIVSFLFACISGGLYFAQVIMFLLLSFGMLDELWRTVIFLSSYILFVLVGYLLFIRREKLVRWRAR